MQVPISQATDIIQKRTEELENNISKDRERIEAIKKQLDILKVKLYSKFKDQINLEE